MAGLECRIHFVDRHMADLISKIYLVDPILDGLLHHQLITYEEYDIVRSKPISQEKMRQIFRYTRGWSMGSKDILYNILKKENGPLIKTLESSEGLPQSHRVVPNVPETRPPRRPVQRAEDEGAAASNMTDALTCCVCMELYTDPVSLPCGHSYCMGCITRTWQNQHPGVASCPLCARTYPNRPELNKNWGLCQLVEAYRAQPGQHS
ncbi:uncharacterized protein [Aquarana catesbeiana]|uniref:uncharacterized protein isoform X2 n=1 Tax=Aquarana catesbeiana TaxID=8400 RepID=UPI003CC9E071